MSSLTKLAELYASGKLSAKEYTELIRKITKIEDLQKRLKLDSAQNLPERLKKAKTKRKINRSAEQLVDISREPWRCYHIEDLLTQLLIFEDYPFVVLDTFFSHPNEEEVTFKEGKTPPFIEKLPIVLYGLLPGSYPCRWERPRKIATGGLVARGGIYVTADLSRSIEGEIIQEIPSDCIPNDYPVDVIKLPEGTNSLGVLKPRQMKFLKMPNWWYQTSPGVAVCPSCSRIPDGDELRESVNFCPKCTKTPLVHTRTVPATLAKSWYVINATRNLKSMKKIHLELRDGKIDPPLVVPVPKFARDAFNEIFFTENIQVTHFYYELQRRYTHSKISTNPLSIYFHYGGRPVALGTQLVTDGFVLKYNEKIIDEVVESVITSEKSIEESKSILVQFMFHVTREALKSTLGYFEYYRVFKILIKELLTMNKLSIPFDLKLVQSQILSIVSDEERIKKSLLAQKPELPEDKIKHLVQKIEENKAGFEKTGIDEFKNFISTIIVHSLAHAFLDSLNKVAGAAEHATGYFFDEKQKTIYIFDTVNGGSGLSETTKNFFYLPFSYRNAVIRQRLGRFDTTPTFLPSRDFLTYLEECFDECTDYISTRILFETVKCLDLPTIQELWRNPEKRTEFVKKLVENSGLLLADQASLLEFNIRNGTALLFKYLQSKLSINNYQDLFALGEVPDLTYEFLSREVSEKELEDLLRHEDTERQKQEMRDLLSLCYACCPACSLPSRCIYGYFEPRYYVNHRISRLFYRHLIKTETINPRDQKNMDDFVSTVKKTLKEKKVAYIEVDTSQHNFDVVSPFLGYRDGEEFKVLINEDFDLIYKTTNFKVSQTVPMYDGIQLADDAIRIPQVLLIKLELS